MLAEDEKPWPRPRSPPPLRTSSKIITAAESLFANDSLVEPEDVRIAAAEAGGFPKHRLNVTDRSLATMGAGLESESHAQMLRLVTKHTQQAQDEAHMVNAAKDYAATVSARSRAKQMLKRVAASEHMFFHHPHRTLSEPLLPPAVAQGPQAEAPQPAAPSPPPPQVERATPAGAPGLPAIRKLGFGSSGARSIALADRSKDSSSGAHPDGPTLMPRLPHTTASSQHPSPSRLSGSFTLQPRQPRENPRNAAAPAFRHRVSTSSPGIAPASASHSQISASSPASMSHPTVAMLGSATFGTALLGVGSLGSASFSLSSPPPPPPGRRSLSTIAPMLGSPGERGPSLSPGRLGGLRQQGMRGAGAQHAQHAQHASPGRMQVGLTTLSLGI